MQNNQLVKQPLAGSVYGDATGTTHVVYQVPASWVGARVTFQSITANLFIVFGASNAVEADRTAVSTVVATVMTPSAKTGAYIAAGKQREFQLDTTSTHFSIEADATGSWRGWVSEY